MFRYMSPRVVREPARLHDQWETVGELGTGARMDRGGRHASPTSRVRPRSSLAQLVRPRELRGPTDERVLRVAQRIRLAVALTFAVVILFVPGFTVEQRLTLSAVVLGYAFASALLEALGARWAGFPAGTLTPLLGIATVFAVTIRLPAGLTAGLLFYVLGITFYTCLGGLTVGLWLSAVAVPCAVVGNQLAPSGDRVSTFTLVMFCLLLPSLVVIVDQLTRERRRTAARLARLHDAMRAVTVTPDLQTTLDSIVESIRDAIDAAAAGILLLEEDHLVVAAPSGATAGWTDEDVRYYTSRELGLGDESPLAMNRLEAVVVADVHDDALFTRWSRLWGDALRRFGFASLVAAPLHVGTNVLGVLNAVFARPGPLDEDELMLLEAYAEQASLVIARSQAYQRERDAAEQLAETDRLRAEFLGMVSHELRTPLTVVKGFVDTVLAHWDDLPDDERRELMSRASGNADELSRLVSQLLDFARMDAGHVQLTPRPLGVRQAVDCVLRDIAPVISQHRIDVDVPAAVTVVADSHAFSHVIVNLLTNAVRFSFAGSRIAIAARDDGANVIISVEDEGIGVAPQEQDRIFDRFYQSRAPAEAPRGTGIGLTTARYFTEQQGGNIWVRSQPGEGSTFYFTLPASRVADGNSPDHPGARKLTAS
jgi:K+-sensing histidine kinase KdpD